MQENFSRFSFAALLFSIEIRPKIAPKKVLKIFLIFFKKVVKNACVYFLDMV